MADPTDQEIYEQACELYASDDVDVMTVSVDRNDEGAWVSALVWVPLPEPEERDRAAVIDEQLDELKGIDNLAKRATRAASLNHEIRLAFTAGDLSQDENRRLRRRVYVEGFGLPAETVDTFDERDTVKVNTREVLGWVEERERLFALEDSDDRGPSSNEWHDSDDAAAEIVHDLARQLKERS
jgi:hypothetical protein